MGVPIYGIIAMSSTATDKIGRSVLLLVRVCLPLLVKTPGNFPSPLLDIKYRRRQLEMRRQQIKQWQESKCSTFQEEAEALKKPEPGVIQVAEYIQERAEHIQREAIRQEKEAQTSLGNEFWRRDPRIAPLRGALATWGLTIDDLDVASFHGTSTVANDKNESDVICQQLTHLGRSKGNAVLGIFQKYRPVTRRVPLAHG